MKKMAVFIHFLKDKRWLLFCYMVQLMLLFVTAALYGLPTPPITYVALILSAVFVLYLAASLFRYANEVRRLEAVRKQAPVLLEEQPASLGLQARLANEIFVLLEHRCRQTEERARQEQAVTAQYYTIWSHQAKTPLAAMRLLLQEPEHNRWALEQELFKTEQYVDMALQYQRLNTAATDLVLHSYPVSVLVKQAVKEVSTLFIHKKIGIELGALEGEVLTDKKWLVFVLEQLLTNAVKYTQTGKVTVWCEGETLYIRDTGIGISAQDLPRVFEWGYTGCNGHDAGRSTGIGLSLCKRALTMLGHTIAMHSEVGSGTTISIGLTRPMLETE